MRERHTDTIDERAVLVGLVLPDQDEDILTEYLDELEFLARTAGAETLERFWQKLPHPNRATYVGSGKLNEIKAFVTAHDVDMVIFDDEISPSQQRNIEKALNCKVLDRSMLILDIFANRAQTVQAKTQVELAQMQYLLPRLRGMWTHLDRVKGGIGMRGAGEKEIETDRRIANETIAKLKKKLETIDKQLKTQRKGRSGKIRVALVGYTNVGKSTLMNRLTKAEVFAEDKLFATLDTTVRKMVINHVPFLLSDTVGFIRKLPHHLVESFKTTLHEAAESDVLLHVVDVSHPQFADQVAVVQETLREMDAAGGDMILVLNKIDRYRDLHFDDYIDASVQQEIERTLVTDWQERMDCPVVLVSAHTGEGIDDLERLIYQRVKTLYLQRYPYKASYLDYYDPG